MTPRLEWSERDATPAEEESTRGLLLRLRAGDRDAADALFAEHGARLARAVRAKLSPAHRRFDVDELVQETFRKALPLIPRFEWRGQGAFLAWLLQIALHTFEDWLRREHGRPPTVSFAAGASGEGSRSEWHPVDAGSSPSARLARAEEESLLDRALDQLDEADRDLVIRRAILGQDYASLAALLGIPEASVRMRMSRAIAALSRWAHHHG